MTTVETEIVQTPRVDVVPKVTGRPSGCQACMQWSRVSTWGTSSLSSGGSCRHQ
jgi:hypothetical protein